MPKKGGKKKQEFHSASSGALDEVQASQGRSRAASGFGLQAPTANLPPQSGGTQTSEGSGQGQGPPRQEQQPRTQQAWRQEPSSQPPVHQQEQGQASSEEDWVSVGQGKGGPRGQGRIAASGIGDGMGRGTGRGQGPRPGSTQQEQQPRQGAWGGQRSGSGPMQHQQQKKAPQGAYRDQRPGSAPRQQQQQPQQGAWGGQRQDKRGWSEQSQQSQQSAGPSRSQTTSQMLQQKQQPSAWGPPQAASYSQASEKSVKEVAGVENVAKTMSEVSLQIQKKQSLSQAPMSKEIGWKVPIEMSNIPKRIDPKKAGTLGRRISVRTNMMQIAFGSNFKAHVVHYDVNIEPNTPKYLMRPAFNAAKVELFPKANPAFDGKKNAYSAGYLPFGETATVEVTVHNENGTEKQFKVSFKKAADGDLDLSWLKTVVPGFPLTDKSQKCIQALDIILRMAPILKAIPIGRSFFTPPSSTNCIMPLGGGMDCWVGHFQSAVMGWKPFLNIDVAHKGFPTPQPVLNLIKTICGCDGQAGGGGRPQGRQQGYKRQDYNQGPTELTPDLIEQHKEEINRFLKGLKVSYEIPNQPTSRRVQRVNELVECPRHNSFEHNGEKISIDQYYRLEKKYEIKYPFFPCLWVGGRDRNICFPMELCKIVQGQPTQRKLDENQTSQMIHHAATGTKERENKIMQAFNKMGYNNDPCMKEFGISVSGQFAQIPARILNPPALSYKTKDAYVSKGVWNADEFLQSSSLISGDNTWTILNLNFKTQEGELYDFVDRLRTIASKFGLTIGKPLTPFTKLDTRRNCMRDLQSYFDYQKKSKINLVIVVIPENKGPYGWVKQASELKIGILTQCLKGKTLYKIKNDRTPATITNILLKINAKLNGINHTISSRQEFGLPECLNEPCMMVGADVTHPSPDAKDIPSIAAVVASHDKRALFQYNTEIKLQPPKEEIILDLAEIMKNQLLFFNKRTGHWPLKIIYYRDGVGEGYFKEVLHRELTAIRTACTAVERQVGYKYEPKITFLVVQKRHHTRFFPTDPRDSDDARKYSGEPGNYNVKAGTVVDTEITHPTDIDFYLCSHASIQGTARPTKYRVLWDDADMGENQIEQLTFYLCHMFSRCTRSVSYPAPTYYAHLAAFRARALTQDVKIDLDNLDQEQLKKLKLQDSIRENSPMFFV